jgi:hypothetical protein
VCRPGRANGPCEARPVGAEPGPIRRVPRETGSARCLTSPEGYESFGHNFGWRDGLLGLHPREAGTGRSTAA